jgi:hypothetical protein
LDERIQMELAGLAVQHYAAGRYAYRHAGLQVAGNLFHRAIEYALKAALCRSVSLTGLKRIGHSLESLYKALSAAAPEINNARNRATVHGLDKWETIRYPKGPLERARVMRAGPTALPAHLRSPMPASSPQPDEYELVIQDIDALFADTFSAARLNPEFFFSRLSNVAKSFILEFNEIPSLIAACSTAT